MRFVTLVVAMAFATCVEAAVTGRVVDEDGAPIAGALVRGFARETFEAFHARVVSADPTTFPVSVTRTDADGVYSVDTKGHAMVTVLAEARGKRAGYRIAADGESARTLVLQQGTRRRVHVTDGVMPIAGAVIVDQFSVIRTDENGRAELDEPDGGIFESPFVLHPSYAIGRADPPRRDSDEVLEIVLTAGSSLSGRVLSAETSEPIPNALITLDDLPLARSAADGSFTITNAPPEWQVITATAGDRVAAAGRECFPGHKLLLEPGSSLRGTARNAITGAPAPGTLVWIEAGSAASRRSAVADRDGHFSISAIPSACYRVEAGHVAYRAVAAMVTVEPGTVLQHDIAMAPHAVLSGVVLDEENRPVARAAVSFGGRPNVTGPDGRFSLRVPRSPRGVVLTARKKGYDSARTGPIAITEGQVMTDVEIVLKRE